MIGIWVASDSAILSLNEDSSFTLNGFNPEYWGWDVEWYRKNSSIKVCGKGKWKIENKDDGTWLSLYFVEEQNKPIQFYNTDLKKYENTGCEFPMDLRGSNFPFYNKPPWILFTYIDYDTGDFYEFYKKGSGLVFDKKEK